MKYREMCGERVSALGLGCMRLPKTGGEGDGCIDMDAFEEMMRCAFDSGVNYFDTAYMYHDGMSEIALGKVLRKLGIRDRVYIADKLPPWHITCEEDVERIFNDQLKKTGAEYFDFYLFHSIDAGRWDGMIKDYKIMEKLLRYKEEGKIRHLGFSFHDSLDAFKHIVDEGSSVFEFCQIQLNYADAASGFQAGLDGLSYAAEHGLGVVIMEPLKGGQLALLSDHVRSALPSGRGDIENALDFLWDRHEVSVVLSGMGSLGQLEENIGYASRCEAGMLTDAEREQLLRAGEIFNGGAKVQCTGCRYCMPCPAGINIPRVFSLYNRQAMIYTWESDAGKDYNKLDVKADACIGCRSCVSKCPQSFDIPALINEAHLSLTGGKAV